MFTVVFLSLVGCSFGPAKRPVEFSSLPATLASEFSICAPYVADLSLGLHKGANYLGDLGLEWAPYQGGFVALGADPFGSQVFRFQNKRGKLSLKGRYKSKNLPLVSTDDSGFLIIDDQKIGILVSEVACIMQFKFPHSWVQPDIHATYESNKKLKTLHTVKNGREIVIEWKQDLIQDFKGYCAKISWSEFLFWQGDIRWCIGRHGKLKKALLSSSKTSYQITILGQ